MKGQFKILSYLFSYSLTINKVKKSKSKRFNIGGYFYECDGKQKGILKDRVLIQLDGGDKRPIVRLLVDNNNCLDMLKTANEQGYYPLEYNLNYGAGLIVTKTNNPYLQHHAKR